MFSEVSEHYAVDGVQSNSGLRTLFAPYCLVNSKVLKKADIEYIVAPYEADAQLAFLSMRCLTCSSLYLFLIVSGYIDAVITEDSDLIPYGATRVTFNSPFLIVFTGQVLFKMDKQGYGKEICLERLGEATEISLSEFTQNQFRYMCILSGFVIPSPSSPPPAYRKVRLPPECFRDRAQKSP